MKFFLKHYWLDGLVVFLLVFLGGFLRIDQFNQSLKESLLMGDGGRDLLVAKYFFTQSQWWKIAPINSSSFPSNPSYYFFMAVFNFLALSKINNFDWVYVGWGELTMVAGYLLVRLKANRKWAVLLSSSLFFSPTLTKYGVVIYQPHVALPLIGFAFFCLIKLIQNGWKKSFFYAMFFCWLLATLIHYSNLVFLPIMFGGMGCLYFKNKESAWPNFVKLISYLFGGLILISMGLIKIFPSWWIGFSSWQLTFFNLLAGREVNDTFGLLTIFTVLMIFFIHYINQKIKSLPELFTLISMGICLLEIIWIPPIAKLVSVSIYGHDLAGLVVIFCLAFLYLIATFSKQKLIGVFLLVSSLLVGGLWFQTSRETFYTHDYAADELAQSIFVDYTTAPQPFQIAFSACENRPLEDWYSGGLWYLLESKTKSQLVTLKKTDNNFEPIFPRSSPVLYAVCPAAGVTYDCFSSESCLAGINKLLPQSFSRIMITTDHKWELYKLVLGDR